MTYTTKDNYKPKDDFVWYRVEREKQRLEAARYAHMIKTEMVRRENDIAFLIAESVNFMELSNAVLSDMENLKPVDFQYKWSVIMHDAIARLIGHYTVDEPDEVTANLNEFYTALSKCVIV